MRFCRNFFHLLLCFKTLHSNTVFTFEAESATQIYWSFYLQDVLCHSTQHKWTEIQNIYFLSLLEKLHHLSIVLHDQGTKSLDLMFYKRSLWNTFTEHCISGRWKKGTLKHFCNDTSHEIFSAFWISSTLWEFRNHMAKKIKWEAKHVRFLISP